MESTDPRADGAAQDPDRDLDAAIDGDVEALSRQLVECEAKLAEMRETVLRERADLDNQRRARERGYLQPRCPGAVRGVRLWAGQGIWHGGS